MKPKYILIRVFIAVCGLITFGCSAFAASNQIVQYSFNKAHYLTYDDWEYEDYEKYFGKLPNGSNKRDAWVQLPNGVSPDENPDDPILISLTTYPKRTEPGTPWRVWVTIESLMRQTKKPQKIIGSRQA